MKSIKLTLLFGILATCLGHGQTNVPGSKTKKVVFIIVDGISNDQLKTANTPFLDSISALGSHTEAYVGGGAGTYSETPTVSAVGYNSLLTGTWANKHNVYGNGIEAPNYNYPTIFRLYKDQYPHGKIAIFSSWLDNRTKLLGDGLKETGNLKMDYAFDGLEHDSINFPEDPQRNFMKLIDYTVADRAAKTILEKAPDISWVYLQFTDDMGHGFGDSERFRAAIHFEDGLVGKIWQAVKAREASHGEDWLLLVTTDHGRSEKDGKGHGGHTPRQRSIWIVTNEKNTNSHFREQQPAIVDILPTMTEFMGIDVPLDVRREFDGVPLIGAVDLVDLKAKKQGRKLQLTWKALGKGKGKLYVSDSNNFKTGGRDQYRPLGSVDLEKEQIEIPMNKIPKGYAKLLLETANTSVNTWYLEQ